MYGMKILITGATGLVGSKIVADCLERNIAVNYLTTDRAKINSSKYYQGYFWDPSRNKIDLSCFDGISAIINLAGSTISKRWTDSYKKIIRKSRIDSLNTLHEALNKIDKTNIHSLTSASAIGIYPSSLSELHEEENNRIDSGFLGSVVQEWEEAADQFHNLGLRIAKIRIGLVLSTEGGALPKIADPIRYYMGAPFGTGEQWQSWIHINDLASLFLFVVERNLQGVFNGVSPNPITNNKLVKEIASTLDKTLILPNIPSFVLKVILGEMSQLLLASHRVSANKIEDKGFHFLYPNINIALNDLYTSVAKSAVTQ